MTVSREIACQPVWAPGGWEMAGESTMHDAERSTRNQARAGYAHDTGADYAAVRCVLRHIRVFTRQECWDRYMWSFGEDVGNVGQIPVMPIDYQPSEYDPVWDFVHKSDPRAEAYWVCFTGTSGPPEPGPS